MDILAKYEQLKLEIQKMGSVLVAFSSGVDSAFLLKAAYDALGEKAIACTAVSATFPKRESREAEVFCKERGIRHIVIYTDELAIPGFRENPADRCYICKKALFNGFQEKAKKLGLSEVIEGSNVDDLGDYRPGLLAIDELGIKSPLREVGFTKAEIRACSKILGLPTWEKQSFACLASRFVYGEEITAKKLSMVEEAEELLLGLGLKQFRVRIHGMMARIEVYPADFAVILENRSVINEQLKALGFTYVTMDLNGFRSGSMNDAIIKDKA